MFYLSKTHVFKTLARFLGSAVWGALDLQKHVFYLNKTPIFTKNMSFTKVKHSFSRFRGPFWVDFGGPFIIKNSCFT